LESRGALTTHIDSLATKVVVAADTDSAVVAAYADTVNAAFRACRAKRQ
jgi:hypothetical protein